MLHTTDQPFYNSASLVVADALSRVGMTIDDQAMDWGTVLQRRSSKQPLDKGGWSLFVSVTPVPEYRDPLLGSLLRGNGKDAWIGWPDIPRIETAYNAWLDSDDAGGADAAGARDPVGGVRIGAVHPARAATCRARRGGRP